MTSILTLLNKIKELINQYVYTKEETRENFDNFIENNIKYINGNFIINEEYEVPKSAYWRPTLNGETGATYTYSYSESNGEGIGKGFVLNEGFYNTESWQLKFDFKHDNIRYTGICFLAKLGTYNGSGSSSTALTTWEGSWPNDTAYATYESGSVGYFDITITKIDETHVRLQSEALDRDTTVEVLWLQNAEKLTLGARHNDKSSNYGPCRIKNVMVDDI